MKKILTSILMGFSIFACTVGPKYITLTNREINYYASQKINNSQNYIVAQARISNLNTEARNGYIYSDIAYSYKILGGAIASTNGVAKVRYQLDVKQNKLYIKYPEILSIKTNNGLIPDKKVELAIASLITNSLEYTDLHDFKDRAYVSKVYIGANTVTLVTE